jgi:hypothetical protein
LTPILKNNFLLSIFNNEAITDKYSIGEEFRSQYVVTSCFAIICNKKY